jgi:Fe-S cluster assembly iron-binding protein IscA
MHTVARVAAVAALVAAVGCTKTGALDPVCPAPTDRAPKKDECTLVDWDVVSVNQADIELRYYVNQPGCSAGLKRVEAKETDGDVTLRVVVNFTGDEGATCPTAYASRVATITLKNPLGDRRLFGCRPKGSFVPQGGYNNPAPRDPTKDCRPGH